jgi:hypothetical protein
MVIFELQVSCDGDAAEISQGEAWFIRGRRITWSEGPVE